MFYFLTGFREDDMHRKRFLWVFIPPVLGTSALFVPILIRGEALYWGTAALQFIPWRAYAWQILHSGDLPLWNPLNGMGAPLLANYQSALLYPPVWLTYFFWVIGDVPWMAWSHTLLVVIHLIWGGIGMVLLSRQLGMSELAQAVCGTCYSLCGYLVARGSFFSMIYVGSWLPWVIYFAGFIALPYKRLWLQGTLGKKHLVGLLVSLSLMLLAGHAQLSWYILLLTASWVFIGGIQENGLRRGMLSLLRFCSAVLGAVVLSSIQLLPTAEYLLNSYRSRGVDYSTAVSYSFWPWRLITFLASDFFGNPGRGDYWGYANYWEDAIYLGVFPFLLSVFTATTILKKGKTEQEADVGYQNFVVYLLWVLVIGLFLALGKNNPIYYYLYRYVPTFSMFNAPSRWLILVEFAIILLAGLGLDRLRAPQGKTLYWMRLGTAGGIAVTLSSLLARIFLPDVASTFVRSVAIAGIWLICSGLLSLYVPNVALKKRRFTWSSLVIGIVLFDLLIANWNLNPSIPIEFYKRGVSNLGLESDFSAVKRHYLSAADEYLLKFNRFLRFVDYNPIEARENIRLALIPNLNLLDGIPSVNNFDPLVPYRYRTLMDKIEKLNGDEKTAWLRSLGVGLIEKLDIDQPLGIRFEQLDGSDIIGWVNCARHAKNSQEALELLQKTVEQFEQLVIIEGYNGETFRNDCFYPKAGKVRVVDVSSGSFGVEVAAERRGWLVVRDSWYPGWEARVDGQEVTVYRANYLFKAIQVDSGLHIVSFSYRPLSFYLGGVLSLLGWLLLGMIILFR